MKRMYVTLALIMCALLWVVTGFGQKKQPESAKDPALDSFQKRMELREEIHRRMISKLLHGHGPDEGLFKDLEKMMDESMAHAFQDLQGFDSLTNSSPSYETEWLENATGKTLIITPQKPDQKLDINVQNDLITIKGKSETKGSHGSGVTSFQNSFSIPQDCDGSKVKIHQKDGRILIELPYKVAKANSLPSTEERMPIKPSEDEVTI